MCSVLPSLSGQRQALQRTGEFVCCVKSDIIYNTSCHHLIFLNQLLYHIFLKRQFLSNDNTLTNQC